MAILIAPDSNEAKERVKWEAQRTPYGPGLRPHIYRPYPMMMHLAGPPTGGLGAITIIEQVEVGSAEAAAPFVSRGFRDTPLEALEAYESQQVEFARFAANLDWQKQRLSPNAIAEVERAQDAHDGHLPSVPVTPIRPRQKPGRKPKAALAAGAGA